MDRDKHWDRTERALHAVTKGSDPEGSDPLSVVRASYGREITAEFIEPVHIADRPVLDPDRDSAIFFNFRPDRARQLTEKLLGLGLDLTTMTRYRGDFDCPVAFAAQDVHETLAEILAEPGVKPLHGAETEKCPQGPYFLNGCP